MHDFLIIGAGIIGLSTAMAISERYPTAKFAILEKESTWAFHQTGNNSGVIHSGIYYKPGSLKAKFCLNSNYSMANFCQENGINYEICGKLIVATEVRELSLLENLYQRGLKHGLALRKLCADQVREIEPYVLSLGAIYVPSTGIVNYKQVCNKPEVLKVSLRDKKRG